jgi:hypothetical protein
MVKITQFMFAAALSAVSSPWALASPGPVVQKRDSSAFLATLTTLSSAASTFAGDGYSGSSTILGVSAKLVHSLRDKILMM